MEFEEPLVIEPNKILYFEYAMNMSWAEPIRLEEENIDLDSIRVVFDYNYLLKPEYYDWLSEFGTAHSYENIAYSFKEESEYRVVQYYYEAFTVYANVSQYTHAFDIGNLTFENDFVNLTLYKIIGLTPTFESEILTNNANFSIDFNEASNKITITDLNSNDGLLSVFDQITVILNYSYGPISSYSEIYLLDQFNQTYLTDQEETFYSSLDIDYNFKSESGMALFAEGSATINSDATTFEAIDYCRNPDMSADSKLIGYGSELFDNFEIYEDDRSIIYVADIDMDGEPDYKHVIDVDGDGDIDIVKYGIDDPQGSGEIYWHTVIQDFHSEETKVSRELGEEMRTEWFDLDDQLFAHYDFNIGKLILIIVTLPLLPYHITKMMLPDVDYWAQKSTQRLVHKEEHFKSTFYSVQVDNDQDGFVDSQINFESTDVDVYYEVSEFKKTILAAKYQDIFTFLGEYVLRSISSLFTGSQEDVVFNEYLTEEHLETKDFSTSNLGAQMNAETLSATYRKFTKDITTTYVDSFKFSTLTVIDYNEGKVEEHRIYKDDFKTNEGTSAEGFFEDLSNKHAITNVDTGAQSTVHFDSEIPYSHPANISWKGETWGSDNVPVKYDSLQVIGEDNSYSTNYFEKTIIIRIPNRYSLYDDFGKTSKSKVENDGWVEFEVEGVFITPENGQVYYTSDVYAFKGGTAKTRGHYFYVDSDLNGFYETVYIISNIFTVSREGTPKYDVISIGLNYDGIHDFAPYEKLDQKVESISDFSNLAKESAMFGTDWVYNFNNLEHIELLTEVETIWDEYKPKDQIFEIYKLVDKSKNNPKFSELFYEIRHKTYAIAWEQYKKQLTGDIIEQVFMSVTASLLSAAVEALITASTLGFGWLGAKGMATLTYVAVYTLMTKFSIDRKLHEAESKERSKTFYPASNAKVDPVSLNEKCIYDRVLQDTMAAALLGHPGGYYQTVSGGEPGSTYTGHLVVSPPNLARVLNSFGGFLDLLWGNLWNAGESDPDAYTALDFDDLNLDYLLMSSELPFYNTKLHYIYHNTEYIFDTYNMYSFNTLGALETQVREGSKGQFNAIRPTCIDGAPQYEFIDRANYSAILPQQILYRPVVLSETRYNQIQPALGRLTVKVQCKDYERTLGINPYDMSDVEQKVYEAKVPLNDNGFEYPIKYIFIDVVNFDVSNGFSYFAQDLIVNESDYAIDCGNLYFIKSIEAIVSEKYSSFEDFLAQSWASELIESTIYYNIRVVFDRFVPDTTDETNSLALAQATSYAIMDYFNQYTYAEISSNLISEIAYTETLTFWSTLISAPLVYFGSWAVSAGVGKMFGEAGSNAVKSMLQKSIMGGLVGMAVSPIKEVFQEIIEDGFREALLENLVSIAGGTDDLGFWLSSLSTSFREVKGALGELTFGETNLKNTFSLIHAISSGDVDTRLEIQQRITQDLDQRKEAETAKKEQMSLWDKMLKTDFLKGLFMVIPSVFFGSFSFVALSGLNKMVTSSIKLSPAAYALYKTEQHVKAKKELNEMAKDQKSLSIESVLFNNMEKQAKKPSELDGEALNNIFRGLQDNEIENPPLTIAFLQVNPNPKIETRKNLANKFNEIQLSNWISELTQDFRFEDKKEEFERVAQNAEIIEFENRIEGIKQIIRSELENYPTLLRFVDYTGEVLYDPKHIGLGFRPGPNADKNIKDNKFRREFNIALTTKEYATELQRAYDVNIPLQPYLLKAGKFIKMPISSEISHSQWLTDNHHNIKTDKIFLLPLVDSRYGIRDPLIDSIIDKIQSKLDNPRNQERIWQYLTEAERIYMLNYYDSLDNGLFDKSVDWNPRENSPYILHLKFIFEGLTKLLYDIGVIDKAYISRVEKIVFAGTTSSMSATLSNLRATPTRNSQFRIGEASIDKWFIRIENEINRKFGSNPIQKDAALYLVKDFINSVYSLFGFNSKNPLYRECRMMYLKLGEVLRLAGVDHFKDNHISDLDSFSYGPHQIYHRLKYNPKGLVYMSTLEKIISSLDTALDEKTDFSSEILDKLKIQTDVIVQSFINKMQDVIKIIDLLDKVKGVEIKMFLGEIINNPISDALRKVSDDKDMIKLLYGQTSYPSLSEFAKDNRKLKFFLRIRDRVEQWTKKDFDDIHIQVTDSELLDLQTYITAVVERWIFNNPYQIYVKQGRVFRFGWYHNSDPFLKREYEVGYQIYKAFRLHENDPNISPTAIRNMVGKGIPVTGYLLGTPSETNIGVDTLIAYLDSIEDFKNNARNSDDIRVYDEAINTIKDYIADRHLGLRFKGKTSSSTKYNPIFHQDWYKASLIVFKLVTFGGIHPITFNFLPPELFDGKQDTGLFQPHHMDSRQKHMLQFDIFLLLDPDWHSRFGPLSRTELGVQLTQELRDKILELMAIDRDVTQADIERVFGDLELFDRKVSDWWKSNPRFSEQLDKWNDDRKLIREGKIREFLSNRFTLRDEKGNAILDEHGIPMNPVLKMYDRIVKDKFNALFLLDGIEDISHLLTDRDMELLKRYFKI